MALDSISTAKAQRKMFTSIISTLVSAVEMRDPALRGRSERISRFARAIGKALELPPVEVNSVTLAALLHNIGRLSISEADIFHSQSAATKEETLEYKQAIRSEELLRNIDGLREILPAVKHSFEKFDGSGCPDGLVAEQIPLHARIIAAAHAFDEILASGPGGEKLSTKDALFQLNNLAQEGEIDPQLVKALAIAYRMGLLDVS
jgi:HD-GYP domain-containing protein (c-di-GMP phosphodiesterase class II)